MQYILIIENLFLDSGKAIIWIKRLGTLDILLVV